MNVDARLKPFISRQPGGLIYCGCRAPDGRQTCSGSVGSVYARIGAPPYIVMNEIMYADSDGTYRLKPHAQKQRAAGRKVTLRTRRPLDVTGDPGIPTRRDRDLGRLGDNSARGDELHKGPVRFVCPECMTPNEIPARWLTKHSAAR